MSTVLADPSDGRNLVRLARRLPLREWKRGVRFVRRRYPANVDWDAYPYIHVPLTHGEFERDLRRAGWEGTPYTVKYRGEVLNLRRPAGTDDEGRAMEYHLRTTAHPERDDLIRVNCHLEYSRYEEKTRHLTEPIDWLNEDEIWEVVGRG